MAGVGLKIFYPLPTMEKINETGIAKNVYEVNSEKWRVA